MNVRTQWDKAKEENGLSSIPYGSMCEPNAHVALFKETLVPYTPHTKIKANVLESVYKRTRRYWLSIWNCVSIEVK